MSLRYPTPFTAPSLPISARWCWMTGRTVLWQLSEAQARLFAALWKLRREPQAAEILMREAGLASDRPMDVFKVKAANRGDPVYEGPRQAYEQLVSRQRRLGLYQLVCQD